MTKTFKTKTEGLTALNVREFIPHRDPSLVFNPTVLQGKGGRSRGSYDEIIYGHPRVNAEVGRVKDILSGSQYTWTMTPETLEEEFFLELISSLKIYANYDNDDDHSQVYRLLSDYWFKGCVVFNISWINTKDGMAIELFNIPLSSIQKWNVTDRGVITGITQRTTSGEVEIKREDLIFLTRNPEEGVEGISVLRPFLFLYDNWKDLQLNSLQNQAVAAGGLHLKEVYQEGVIHSQEVRDSLFEAAHNYSEGTSKVIFSPVGYELSPLILNDPLDIGPMLKYYDEQIEAALNNTMFTLGFASHGSKALGETMNDTSSEAKDTQMDSLIALFGRKLATWVARGTEYNGRLPELRMMDVSLGEVTGGEERLADTGQDVDDINIETNEEENV